MAQIPAILSSLTVAVSDSDQKTVKAAKDFEALLIGQMLRSMRGDKSWLGTGDESDSEDSADDSALSLGEQQVAQAIAAGGGLGLSRMIAMGLHGPSVTSAQAQSPAVVAPAFAGEDRGSR